MGKIKHLTGKEISLSTLAEIFDNDSAQTEIKGPKNGKYLFVTYPDFAITIRKRTGGLDLYFAVAAKDNITFESGCLFANRANMKLNFGRFAALANNEDNNLLFAIIVSWSLLTKGGIIASHLISTVRAMQTAYKGLVELDTDGIIA